MEAAAPEAGPEPEVERRIYHVNHHKKRKPMTLDEALLEMEKSGDYLVYRDAETDRVSVLVRRRDGHFDLVEAISRYAMPRAQEDRRGFTAAGRSWSSSPV